MDILLNRVSYTYDEGMSYEKHALVGVDLKISQGEYIGIIGKTGSGKSTMIKTINGLIKPDFGGVFVDGQDIHDRDYELHRLRGRVGMVFQYPENQLFESTVFKDVRFGPSNQGLDDLTCELRAYEALKSVGIGEDLLDVFPLSLSGGQKRRVAIAGVLAMQPEILILDEPTAGLDPAGRVEIFDLITRLNEEEGITILLISHCMEDVAEYTNRVIVMSEGRIVMDDEPAVVFSRVQELAGYGLRPPVAMQVFSRLKEKGINLSHPVITREQAVESILACCGKM